MRYVFDHPDILDKIPKGAVLVILPEDDRELYEKNYKILEARDIKCPRPLFSVLLFLFKTFSNAKVGVKCSL